jgi:hypothetical protein
MEAILDGFSQVIHFFIKLFDVIPFVLFFSIAVESTGDKYKFGQFRDKITAIASVSYIWANLKMAFKLGLSFEIIFPTASWAKVLLAFQGVLVLFLVSECLIILFAIKLK